MQYILIVAIIAYVLVLLMYRNRRELISAYVQARINYDWAIRNDPQNASDTHYKQIEAEALKKGVKPETLEAEYQRRAPK